MREVKTGNIIGRAVLWAFWIGLALAVTGCGEGGGGTPTAPKPTSRASSQSGDATPVIDSVLPDPISIPATAGRFIKILGRNFGAAQFSATIGSDRVLSSNVYFVRQNGEVLAADPVQRTQDWTSTQIRVLLLSTFTEAETIGVKVSIRGGAVVGGVESTIFPNFSISKAPSPQITKVSPVGAVSGQQVTITGSGFGDAQLGSSTVFFTSSTGALVAAGTALQWSDSKIVVTLPSGVASGPVIVSRGSLQSVPSSSTSTGDKLVVSDNTPPTLLSSSPSRGQTLIDPRTAITLVFSEAMGSGTTNEANYLLTSNTGKSVDISPTITALSASSFRLQPKTNLEGGAAWTLGLSGNTGGPRIADLAGNALVNLSLTFGTANVPGVPGSDVTPPLLVSASPPNNAVEVDVGTSIVLTFNEPVTFSADPVSVSSAGGPVLLDQPTPVGPATIFTIRPRANLIGGVLYKVSFGDKFVDPAGNKFAGALVQFTTREVPGLFGSDRTPPRLVSSNPSQGTSGVSPSADIVLIFSETLDAKSARSKANYRLTTSGGVTNPTTASPSGSTVVLQFAGGLLVDTSYTLFLDSAIQDQALNALSATSPLTFRTLNIPGKPGDTTPPRIITFSPANGDQNVSTSGDLIYTYSEEMDPSRLTATSSYSLTSQDGSTDLTLTAIGKSGIRLTPKRSLIDDRDYTLLLTSLLTDKVGNTLSPVSIRFHTANIPGDAGDRTAPTLVSSSPPSGATSVDPNSPIVLVFSEPITNASDRNRYTLQPSGSTGITPTSASPSGSSVALDFGTLLVDTDYTLRLSGLLDRANNALQATSPIAFRTVNIPGQLGDHTSPRVVNDSPTEGQVVGVDTELFITFSERMKTSTLSKNTIRLTTDGGRVDINVTPVGETSVAISPTTGKLLSNTAFQLFLGTSITDVVGNPLNPFTLNFRSANVVGVPGSDVTPPVIAQSTPANGATNVDPFSNLLLVFSEPMDITEAKNVANYHLRAEGTSVDVTLTSPAVVFRNFVSLTPQTITPLIPPLLVDTNYSLSIESNRLKDSAGNLLPPTSPIFFRTADIPGLPGDKKPPTALSVNPTGLTSVTTGTEIFVTFSELMNPGTFSSNNIILTTSGGTFPIVTASIFAGTSALMKIQPGHVDANPAKSFKLLPGLRYDLLLTSGLTDKAGNPLVPFTSFFLTLAQSSTGGKDVTPPALLFSNPADGSTNVDPNTDLLLTFSEELTPTAKNKANFTITSDAGSAIPTQDAQVVSSPPNSLRVDPGKLLGNTRYVVVLGSSITDKANNPLRPTAFAFTTAQVVGTDQDRTPPTVLSTNPPTGSAAVGIDSLITVTFSKAVNFTAFNSNALTSTAALTSAMNPLNYDLFSTFDNPGIVTVTFLPFPPNTVQLTPKNQLRGGTVYDLIASSRIQDKAKNNLISTLVTFTTIDQPGTGTGDSTRPQVTATNPPNGNQVTNDLTNIVITFSEPMTEGAVTSTTSVLNISNYVIETGCTIAGLSSSPTVQTPLNIVKLDVPANSYRIAFTSNASDPLPALNSVYLVELSNRISDRAGNPLNPFSFTFTQGAPPAAPKVDFTSVDTSPVGTNTGTAGNRIVVTFDRSVVDSNGGTLANNFIVAGTAKDAQDITSSFATDYAIETSTLTSGSGSTYNVQLKRSAQADNDANFRLKKASAFTLVVTGFKSVDPCGTQDQQSFTKNFGSQ